MINKQKSMEIAQKIYARLNGIISFNDMKDRIKNFYFYEDVIEKKRHDEEFCRNYFMMLDSLKEGFIVSEIAKKIDVKIGTIRSWLRGQTPYTIKIASSIPSEIPKSGYKWLPVHIKKGWKYTDFVQVPTKINDYSDVIFVLKQLKEMKTKENWESFFGKIDKEEAFGYIIGMLISDADKDSYAPTISTRIKLGLSRVYKWNIHIGEALCYCLSVLGIRAKRIKDGKVWRKIPHGKYRWQSEYSPLITWMKRTCLGLSDEETTTYTTIKADWILNASEKFRKSVLNGLYDGDGCAAIKSWQITNACRPNQKFVQKLLKTFNIKSRISGPKVVIEVKESLMRAAGLCIFRFSKGKVEKSVKLLKMLQTSKQLHKRLDYEEILNTVFKLNNQNYKAGEISVKIFDKFQAGIAPRRVYTILERGSDKFGVKKT